MRRHGSARRRLRAPRLRAGLARIRTPLAAAIFSVLAASESDAAAARAIAPSAEVRVYPNAVPARPIPAETRRHAIVFSGNMEYHPNRLRRPILPPRRSGRRLRDRIRTWSGAWSAKTPNAVRAFTAGDPRIEVSGEVEDAVRGTGPAEVAVVPLLAGSGTRLKILEAWAAGTPVVSTTIGAEGLPVRDGQHLLLADGASAVRSKPWIGCWRAMTSRESLAVAGRLLLEKEFTWEKAWRHLVF